MKMSWQKLKNLIQTMDERREGSQSGKAFEELVARLLELHLKIPFVVAKSGTQPSGDARSMDGQVAIQAKNYSKSEKLDAERIVRDILRVDKELEDLQIYVLTVSCEASQLYDELVNVEKKTGLDIVVLELTDKLSDLGALCVTYWRDLQDFQEFAETCENQELLDWMEKEKQEPKTKDKIKRVKLKLENGIQTQIHFQKDAEEHLLRYIGETPNDNPRFDCSIDLSKADDRYFLESEIESWWNDEIRTQPVCYLEGEKNSGKSWLAAKWVKSIYRNRNIVPIWLDSRHWSKCKTLNDLLHTCFESIYGLEVEGKIDKLRHKICYRWCMPTLIIIDGISEPEAIGSIKAILNGYFEERRKGKTKCGYEVRLLLTTRPLDDYQDFLDDYQDFKDNLWRGCYKILVEPFNDSKSQDPLTTEVPKPIGLPNLWTNLLEKIEHTKAQVPEKLGWSESENAQEILARLAKQEKWTNVDTATQVSAQLFKKCFSNYRETRQDLAEQRVAREDDDAHVKVNQGHIILGWALYFSNLFDCQECTTIKEFVDRFRLELGSIIPEDPRTEALFVALQISAVFSKVPQEPLWQKRAALILMLARFNNYNPRLAGERLSFWAEQDTDAYAQAVEFEFEHRNSPDYEDALIAPLAKTWLHKAGQTNCLASYLTKWLQPTYANDVQEELVYTHITGQPLPREKIDIQFHLLDAALSILSVRPERQFLKTLARCYAILHRDTDIEANISKRTHLFEKIGKLMRWGYTEAVLGDLYWLAELTQSDKVLLRGVYGLAECLKIENLPPRLQRPLSKEEQETRTRIEESNRNFISPVDRIRGKEQVLIGDSPEANVKGDYRDLDYWAVRTDLPCLTQHDQVEIKKTLHHISMKVELSQGAGATFEDYCIENLIPWVAKYDPEGYTELACKIKLNALNQKWAQFKFLSIQGLIFTSEDCERITEAILGVKERLAQGKDFYPDIEWLTSLLTESLLFSASEKALTDWFEFLALHEPLRVSICYEPLPRLMEILLPESIVKLAQQKLKAFQSSSSDNQTLSGNESREFSEEEFWSALYAYGPRGETNTVECALEKLKLKDPDSTGTFPLLHLALSEPKQFLDETLNDDRIRKHLFSQNSRRFIVHPYKGADIPDYELLRSFLPPEVTGSFLCSPERRDDLSRWGEDFMQWMCSILQEDEGDSNSVTELRFGVNQKVLKAWAEQNETDFLKLANEYLIGLSKSPWYCQALGDVTDTILCLFLRFQPVIARQYYRQSNAESFRIVYRTPYGIETFLAQLWQVEDCSLSKHRHLRRKLLEECLNDEDLMFTTLAALAGGGEAELWSLVTQEYLKSPHAKERNLGVSILPWFGTCDAIKELERLMSNDQSKWVREHAAWAYEVAQQERSCREVYWKALQTCDPFQISAVFERIKPALSPTARWWHRHKDKEKVYEELQNCDPKLLALVERFWYRWGNSLETKSNFEVFGRKLREYYRGEELPTIGVPRIAPWWKPTSHSDSL